MRTVTFHLSALLSKIVRAKTWGDLSFRCYLSPVRLEAQRQIPTTPHNTRKMSTDAYHVVDIEKKRFVIKSLFQKDCSIHEIDEYDTYFKHYNKEMDLLGKRGVEGPSTRVTTAMKEMRSHPDKQKIEICRTLLTTPNAQNSVEQRGEGQQAQGRQAQESQTRGQQAEDPRVDQVNRIINCAVRVWLMIICRLNDDARNSTVVYWDDNESLLQFVDRIFRISPTENGKYELNETDRNDMRKEALEATSQLTHRLTGMNLERYTNIKTVPTDYLHQHLNFDQTYFNAFKHRLWLLDTIAIHDKTETASEESTATEGGGSPKSGSAQAHSTNGSNPFTHKTGSGSESSPGSSSGSGNSNPSTHKIGSGNKSDPGRSSGSGSNNPSTHNISASRESSQAKISRSGSGNKSDGDKKSTGSNKSRRSGAFHHSEGYEACANSSQGRSRSRAGSSSLRSARMTISFRPRT